MEIAHIYGELAYVLAIVFMYLFYYYIYKFSNVIFINFDI